MKNLSKDNNVIRHTWKRTGKTTQELSHNKGGTITFAEEVNEKGHKRLVQIEYKTIIKNNGDK